MVLSLVFCWETSGEAFHPDKRDSLVLSRNPKILEGCDLFHPDKRDSLVLSYHEISHAVMGDVSSR